MDYLTEGFPVLTLMSLNSFNEEIISYSKDNKVEEICGFVLLCPDNSVEITKEVNVNPDPSKSFSISPQKFINYSINRKILGIYHSHPFSDESPSAQDILCSEESGIPYLIYSLQTNKFFLYYPGSYDPAELIGRPYVKGFYECTCLFKDYFLTNLNLNITKWNKNYWLTDSDDEANDLLINILNKNTKNIEIKEIKEHDILVFQIKNNGRKHVGIYLGNDYFIHQCGNTISRKQLLDNRWQSKIKRAYRHPSLV